MSLKNRGLGVLFITHDLSLGNDISDRTVILRYGAVVEMGGTEKVFGHPQHSYTRHLLTAVPQLHRKWQAADDDRRAARRRRRRDRQRFGGTRPEGAGIPHIRQADEMEELDGYLGENDLVARAEPAVLEEPGPPASGGKDASEGLSKARARASWTCRTTPGGVAGRGLTKRQPTVLLDNAPPSWSSTRRATGWPLGTPTKSEA